MKATISELLVKHNDQGLFSLDSVVDILLRHISRFRYKNLNKMHIDILPILKCVFWHMAKYLLSLL